MIWHLIDSSGVGGAERHVATLAESCSKRRVDVKVVLLNDNGPNAWQEQLKAINVRWQALNGTVRHLISELRCQRPLLVHTHGYKANLFGRLTSWALGVPVVSTFHSGARSGFPVLAYEWLDEWSAFASENIAVSEEVAARLPWSSTHMSSYVALPAMPTEKPLPPSVAFVGRLSPEKGPDVFCELAARAKDLSLTWEVYGEGCMRKGLQARYDKVVRFHGAVSNLDRVWPTIGLLVMPSRFEGMPLAALEAMAHGIPVVAAPVGGLKQIVCEGVTGWHFTPGDRQEGLDKIVLWKALSPEGQHAIRKNCRDFVSEKFSENAQFAKLVDVYLRAGLNPADVALLQSQVSTKPGMVAAS